MKKITVLFLMIISVLVLGGCEPENGNDRTSNFYDENEVDVIAGAAIRVDPSLLESEDEENEEGDEDEK